MIIYIYNISNSYCRKDGYFKEYIGSYIQRQHGPLGIHRVYGRISAYFYLSLDPRGGWNNWEYPCSLRLFSALQTVESSNFHLMSSSC